MADHKIRISRRQAIAGIASVSAVAAVPRRAKARSWGRVFVFNTALEKVELKLNRRALPAIVGTEREAYYIPDVISVDRTSLLPDLVVGEFAKRNKLHVRYPDREALYEIEIDASKYQLERDLQLYVHRDGLVLLQDGIDISENIRKIS
jgi:hypothetical protein